MTALPQPRTARRDVNILFLITAGSSAVFVYSAILLRLPLWLAYTVRLKNLNQMTAADWPTGLLIVGCVLLLLAGYAVGAASIAAMAQPRRAWLPVLGFAGVFAGLLMFVFPITSTDIYDYLFRGRMLAHYGANPFIIMPQAFPRDPMLPYIGWKQAVTAYGPLWEDMSALVAWLAGETPGAPAAAGPLVLRYLLGYKALALLGYLLTAGAIWGALRDATPGERWAGVYLWLWNPLVLWETAANGHNDVWMALWVVVAIVCFSWGKRDGAIAPYMLALLALTAGGLIKFIAFFFGPVLLMAALRRLTHSRARWRLLVLGGAACLALLALAYAPFWSGSATLQSIGNRRTMYNASWLAALRPLLETRMPNSQAQTIAASIGMAFLLLGVGWASWRAWRAPDAIVQHILWLALWFLLICNPWFQPWYVIWVIGLAALLPWQRRTLIAIGVFCCTALIGYVVDGLILPLQGFADNSFGREGWMTVFIYLPPLVALAWGQVGLLSAARQLPAALESHWRQPSKHQ